MKQLKRVIPILPLLAASMAIAAPVHADRSAVRVHAAVTLNIATVNNPNMIEMQHLTPIFEKQYGIKVNYVTLPENTLRQKVTADVATGGGQFDLATVGTYEVPIWAKNGWIVNLNSYFSKMSAADAAAYDLERRAGQGAARALVQGRSVRPAVLRRELDDLLQQDALQGKRI